MTTLNSVWLARAETTNFVFDAVGTTEQQAREALDAGWRVHCEQTGAELTWLEDSGQIHVEQVPIAACRRDGDIIAAIGIDQHDS